MSVRPNNKGRGVYATRQILNGNLIETSPVILVHDTKDVTKKSILNTITFEWTKKISALALGYGSLFNHSLTPNARWVADRRRKAILFFAIRGIAAGEEVTFFYDDKVSFRVKK